MKHSHALTAVIERINEDLATNEKQQHAAEEKLAKLRHREAELKEQLARAQQDSRTLLRHAHRAADAHDQRHSDLALQRVDLL